MKLQMILSACGTSVLMHHVEHNEERKLIIQYANKKELNEIPKADADAISKVVARAKAKVLSADIASASRISAELNGIIKLYHGKVTGHQDFHVLLCTDTWLGETTAQLVATWLQQQGMKVQVLRQSGLQTEYIDEFQWALSELVQWCEETVMGYRQKGYHVIFNLTGGFKSVQGFLQTLALFYADETVYIFEQSKHLMRIPRLPVKMDAEHIMENNILAFRRLSMNLPVSSTSGISETLLMKVDGEVALSAWGDLVWGRSKAGLYGVKLYPTPSAKIRYTPAFEKNVENLAKDRLLAVNTRMDQLGKHLESQTQCNLAVMNFRSLSGNPSPPSTHEINAWSDDDAKRIFGHYEGDVFVLDRLGKAFH